MKAKNVKRCGTVLGILAAVLVYLVLCAFSWGFTCAVIKLITICFGWTFNLAWATGIWLVIFLLRCTFSHYRKRAVTIYDKEVK